MRQISFDALRKNTAEAVNTVIGRRGNATKSTWAVLVAITGLLFIPSIAPATGQASQERQTIKIESDLVAVDADVTDKSGAFVRGLKANDFVVTEDGIPQKVDFFEANENAELTRPLAVVFSLDVSGSIEPEEILKQREAAESFVKLVRPESEFAVIAFNYDIRVLQDFTSDPKKLDQAFRKIGRGEGSTRIFGAIDRAVTMLKKTPRTRQGRLLRRVVVVITDGYDSVDSIDQHELIRRANDAGVSVYSITLPSYMLSASGKKRRALTLLDASQIVDLTGGADFSADSRDFTMAFKSIAEEIRSSYTLAFYPPDRDRHDGKVHQIHVEVRRPDVIVKTSRKSYLAEK
ncbi:MAG TPA: VWA domain-containing protein [Blastocatellia bacterium]|nr:VWA domain-containing protein [Blastocatellia bacterium]